LESNDLWRKVYERVSDWEIDCSFVILDSSTDVSDALSKMGGLNFLSYPQIDILKKLKNKENLSIFPKTHARTAILHVNCALNI